MIDEILRRAGQPNMDALTDRICLINDKFGQLRETAVSILSATLSGREDPFLARKLKEIEDLKVPGPNAIEHDLLPSKIWTRDTLALGQGLFVAPHQSLGTIARFATLLDNAFNRIEQILRISASHLIRANTRNKKASLVGTNVFIGHGRSPLWRELKDFIKDRLSLPVDEFNSVPVAGISTTARLSELLEAAAFAFLIMTAEDEHADDKLYARLNVVHEVGLFQGRLGFTRAIVLLEARCEEFSNIHGLGQIRFPTGNISAIFESVRAVLEREGLLAKD